MKNETAKNIGLKVNPPSTAVEDKNCPFFGNLRLRGRIMTATVISSKVPKTATVRRYKRHYLPKYQRFERRISKIRVHNPASINAQEGNVVKIAECRPISKTKRFVIIEIIDKNELVESNKEEENETN